jgi:hypothetical protein
VHCNSRYITISRLSSSLLTASQCSLCPFTAWHAILSSCVLSLMKTWTSKMEVRVHSTAPKHSENSLKHQPLLLLVRRNPSDSNPPHLKVNN